MTGSLWQEEGEQWNWLPDEFRKLTELISQIRKRKIPLRVLLALPVMS